jgi:CxC5 like cysteine cluster associated with KDZ transposases
MLLANISAQVPTLSIIGLFNFIHIAKQLRNDILLAQPAEEPEDEAPGVLPPSMTKLLADSCVISLEDVNLLWDELRLLIWGTYDFIVPHLDKVVLKYRHSLGLAADTLYPPQHSCIQSGCSHARKGLCMKKTYYQKAVLYTLDHGAVPAYSVSLYCEGVSSLFNQQSHAHPVKDCKISYYHNYYIKDGHRYYYTHPLHVIEVGGHQFVKQKVVKTWINVMVVSH